MSTHLDDQRAAAEAELDALTAPIRARAERVDVETTPDSLAEFAALLDRTDPCMHLAERPVQPSMVLLGYGVADCVPCFLSRRGRVRQCMDCGQEAQPLHQVLQHVGHRIAVALVCRTCFERAEARL